MLHEPPSLIHAVGNQDNRLRGGSLVPPNPPEIYHGNSICLSILNHQHKRTNAQYGVVVVSTLVANKATIISLTSPTTHCITLLEETKPPAERVKDATAKSWFTGAKGEAQTPTLGMDTALLIICANRYNCDMYVCVCVC